ncbi:hypothetical protein LNL84_07850, partial [Vibrio sp. ZSDZ34]
RALCVQGYRMKVNGLQYYWLVASGLILYIALVVIGIVCGEHEVSTSNLMLSIYLVAWLPAAICYYTVILEMWSVFRFKLILVAITLLTIAFSISNTFLLLIALAPHIYWLWRINGINEEHT